MYMDDSPILESVFAALAPDACNISDIVSENMPAGQLYWYFEPLSYAELSEWATEERVA